MSFESDLYEEVVQVYTRLVERDSRGAADAVRRIQSTAGAHAAMRAALILTLLKREAAENDAVPNLNAYTYLLREYPDAVVELETAIAYCLPAWGIQDVRVALPSGHPPVEFR